MRLGAMECVGVDICYDALSNAVVNTQVRTASLPGPIISLRRQLSMIGLSDLMRMLLCIRVLCS